MSVFDALVDQTETVAILKEAATTPLKTMRMNRRT